MTVAIFLEQSRCNLGTAKSWSGTDANSACSRAYYAIRDAARAALLAIDEAEAAHAKTHSGLRAQFNLLLIKRGFLPQNLNATFAFASQRRMVADYDGILLTIEDAEVIARAEQFLKAVTGFIESRQ